MAELRIANRYQPLIQQEAFRRSTALFRGFGGAMGGGKTRALGEEAFDMMLDLPGISIAAIRQKHTAIRDTTRKTFIEQVLPPELRGRPDLVRIKNSGGEDFVEFRWNGSRISFYGLDDPGKFFSAEFGAAMIDEAHEVDEQDVITINSRLRQKCPACHAKAATYQNPADAPDCNHYPHSMILTFNPSFPGHWLQKWFILGATRTEYGFRKEELMPDQSEVTIGDCEFFVSRATDNLYLSSDYVKKNLGGMPEMQRRRYLEGLWEHISGSGFFDQDALSRLTMAAAETPPYLVGEAKGDPTGKDPDNQPTIKTHGNGRLEVFKPPVRWHVDDQGEEHPAHRYVLGIDSSSGAAADYSGIQVLDVDEWEQVAEWQGKVDPDRLAEHAFLIACIYNGALLVPEITGGWGFAVTKALQRHVREWEGSPKAQPRLYTRRITDRLSDKFTDALGWDTNRKTRAHMLSVLEELLRDDLLVVHGQRTLAELASFAFPDYNGTGDYGVPRARKGQHDDLTVALAVACAVGEREKRAVRYEGRPLVMRTG